MSKVLVISPDEIKKAMAGPAIRAFEIARHLKKEHRVTLVYRPTNLQRLISEHDVVICQHLTLNQYPILANCDKSVVFDLYNLSMFECLEIAIKESSVFQKLFGEYHPLLRVYIEVLKAGDFFICANERQRSFWLGMLAVLGRIDINRYRDAGENLNNLIEVIPFGIPDEQPTHTQPVLKGVYPQIQREDKVIIWAGGVYDWLDPITCIRAMHKVISTRQEVKLFFMGTETPNRILPKMRLCQEAIKLSRDLGFYNKNVFFNGWVKYDKRQNYLLEADIGITTHHKNMEAYFSSRTRILDYIWANLPIIISEGDGFSGIVERYNLGLVVKDSDVDGVAEAILRLLNDKDFYNNCKENLKKITSQFYWDKLIEPLNRFCHHPEIIRDRSVKIAVSNKLFYHIFQIPYYITFHDYKYAFIRFFKKILAKPRYLLVILKMVLVFIFSFFILAITFLSILLNDLLIMPFYRKNNK